MTDFKPGTIAEATVRGVPDVTVMRHMGGGWFSAEYVAHWRNHGDKEVTDVRPLVVLDLDAGPLNGAAEVARGLRLLARADDGGRTFRAKKAEAIADQIEAQTRPAIEEPKGLGAVVEDAEGTKFVRVADYLDGWMAGRDWQRIGGAINTVRNFGWSDVDAVRVLSPGVES